MRIALFSTFLLTTWLALFATSSFAANETTETTPSTCSALTTPYSATYYGSYKGWRIDAVQRLEKRQDNKFRLSLHADNLLGSILEKSIFDITRNGQINSLEHSYLRKVLASKNEQVTHFDWSTKRAMTTGNKTGDASLSGGELDDLNYQLMLRCDLMTGKTNFIYPVVDRDEISKLEFKIIGEEVLDTKLGKLNTIIVKRVRNNNNRITTLWFAKDIGYVMVKLLQEERKDTEAYLLYINSLNK